jgi:hypothetical protein
VLRLLVGGLQTHGGSVKGLGLVQHALESLLALLKTRQEVDQMPKLEEKVELSRRTFKQGAALAGGWLWRLQC